MKHHSKSHRSIWMLILELNEDKRRQYQVEQAHQPRAEDPETTLDDTSASVLRCRLTGSKGRLNANRFGHIVKMTSNDRDSGTVELNSKTW